MNRIAKKYFFKYAPRLAIALSSWLRRRRDYSDTLAARKILRAEIFKNAEPVVFTGPFAGMRYIDEYIFAPIAFCWLGIYEAHLNPWIQRIMQGSYDSFIDIGAAEGYYSVGIARARPDLKVVTFEADPFSRGSQRRLAALNGVKNVDIRSLCNHRTLEKVLGKRPFVLCDIEGGEVDLIDPIRTPGLRRADLIVETHLTGNLLIPQVTELIANRFRATHRIEVIHEEAERVAQARLLDELRQHGVTPAILDDIASKRRLTLNEWLILTARQNNGASIQIDHGSKNKSTAATIPQIGVSVRLEYSNANVWSGPKADLKTVPCHAALFSAHRNKSAGGRIGGDPARNGAFSEIRRLGSFGAAKCAYDDLIVATGDRAFRSIRARRTDDP